MALTSVKKLLQASSISELHQDYLMGRKTVAQSITLSDKNQHETFVDAYDLDCRLAIKRQPKLPIKIYDQVKRFQKMIEEQKQSRPISSIVQPAFESKPLFGVPYVSDLKSDFGSVFKRSGALKTDCQGYFYVESHDKPKIETDLDLFVLKLDDTIVTTAKMDNAEILLRSVSNPNINPRKFHIKVFDGFLPHNVSAHVQRALQESCPKDEDFITTDIEYVSNITEASEPINFNFRYGLSLPFHYDDAKYRFNIGTDILDFNSKVRLLVKVKTLLTYRMLTEKEMASLLKTLEEAERSYKKFSVW
jgi:hypothetical protein